MDAADLPPIPEPFVWKRPYLGGLSAELKRWTIVAKLDAEHTVASVCNTCTTAWNVNTGRHRDFRLERRKSCANEREAIDYAAAWVTTWAAQILAEIEHLERMPKAEREAFVDRELKRMHRH